MKRKPALIRRKVLAWILTAMVICMGTTAAFAEEEVTESPEAGIVTTAEVDVTAMAENGSGDTSTGTGTAADTSGTNGSSSTEQNNTSDSNTPAESENTVVSLAETSNSVKVDNLNAVKLGGTVKYGSDKKKIEDEEFSFVLKDKTGNKDVETVKNNSEGKYEFTALKLSQTGEYVYTVEQQAPTKTDSTNYVFDKNVYTIKFTVTSGNGSPLTATAEISKAAAANTQTASNNVQAMATSDTPEQTTATTTGLTTLDFTNEYNGKNAFAQITAKKTLTGKTLQKDEFSFILSEVSGAEADLSNLTADGLKTMLTQTPTTIETKKNDANGKILFTTLSYDKIGAHLYQIKEDSSAKASGITYDTSAYYVLVTVKPDDSGKYTADVKYYNSTMSPIDAISFANKYAAASTSSGTTTKTTTTTTPKSNTTNNNNTSTAGKAKTGDDTPLGLYAAVLAGCALVLGGVTIGLRRKKTGKNQ